MKKHITFQVASYELQNTKKCKRNVNNLIHQQRNFEEVWPSKRSKAKLSVRIDDFFDENVFDAEIEIKAFNISELVEKAEETIKLLRHTLEKQ